jgi:hypothetical protein
MGKKFEKHFKENELFCFWGSEGPRRFPIGDLGGSDPVSRFGRQNRTNTGVAPAQIEVFVRGLFSDRRWRKLVSDLALRQRGTEHKQHILTRTLRMFQCSVFRAWSAWRRVKTTASIGGETARCFRFHPVAPVSRLSSSRPIEVFVRRWSQWLDTRVARSLLAGICGYSRRHVSGDSFTPKRSSPVWSMQKARTPVLPGNTGTAVALYRKITPSGSISHPASENL